MTTKNKEKFDFTDSFDALKGTAKKFNKQVKEVREELFDDLKENSEQLVDMTVKPVQKVYNNAVEKVTETMKLENLSKTTMKFNNYTLKTAEELIEGVIVNGEKWQGVADKAIKGGLKPTAKQQSILFDTLETMKKQLTDSSERLKKLFSDN